MKYAVRGKTKHKLLSRQKYVVERDIYLAYGVLHISSFSSVHYQRELSWFERADWEEEEQP